MHLLLIISIAFVLQQQILVHSNGNELLSAEGNFSLKIYTKKLKIYKKNNLIKIYRNPSL